VRGGAIVWITGLPGAGKSTLAATVAERLRAAGTACALLDGDEVRAALGLPAGRGPEERDAFYAALARLAALLAGQGLVAVVAATANRAAHRERARALAPRYLEVHVATPAAECARRDPRGLYAAARSGAATGVPGADAPYEAPAAPDVVASGGEDGAAVDRLIMLLAPSAPRGGSPSQPPPSGPAVGLLLFAAAALAAGG
jgi:adenylylsulfate kinase